MLVIERLDWLTLFEALLARWRGRTVWYVGELPAFRTAAWLQWLCRRGIRRLDFQTTPTRGIGWTVQERLLATVAVLASSFRRDATWRATVRRWKLDSVAEEKFAAALEHALCGYFYGAVKTAVLAQDVAAGKPVVISGWCLPELARVDSTWRRPLTVWGMLAGMVRRGGMRCMAVGADLRALAAAGIKLWRSEPEPLAVPKATVAYFPMNTAYTPDREYFDTVLFDADRQSPLHPSNLLHCFHAGTPDAATRAYLAAHKVPIVNLHELPGDRQFHRENIRALLHGALPAGLAGDAAARQLAKLERQLVVWRYWLRQLPGVKVCYAAYDQSFPKTAVTAMRQLGIISFSAMYGEQSYVVWYMAHYNYDWYALPGARYEQWLRRTRSVIGRYVVTGVQRSDLIHAARTRVPDRYVAARERYRLVTAIDFGGGYTAFEEGPNCVPYVPNTLRFYAALLAVLDRYPELFIAVKLRAQACRDDYAQRSCFADLRARLAAQPRLMLDAETDTYELLALGDPIIVNHASTTGLEALAAGKKVLFYELADNPHHGFAEYGIVARTEEEFLAKFERMYRGTDDYPWQRIRAENCGGWYDGQCRARIRRQVLDVLAEVA